MGSEFELQGGVESGLSSDFELKGGPVGGWSSEFERTVALREAGAVISSAKWLRCGNWQCFRAPSPEFAPFPPPIPAENLLINIYIYRERERER